MIIKQLFLEVSLVIISIFGYVSIQEVSEESIGHKHHEDKRYERPIERASKM